MNLHNPTKRVLDILNIVSKHERGLSLTEISELIDSPKSTLSPILNSMQYMDFLMKEKDSNLYKIGLSSLLVGYSYINNSSGINIIEDKMNNIIEQCNEVCNIGILDGNEVFYLIKVSGDRSLRLMSSIGKRLPVHSTALGKALISNKNYEEMKEFLPEKLEKFTEKTLDTVEKLYEDIQNSKKEGLFYENEEITEYARCIAIPLKNKDEIIGALSISFPTFRADMETVETIKMLLKENADVIEKVMSIYDIH